MSFTDQNQSVYDWSWFRRGIGGFGTLPSLVLTSAFIGFGGLARDAGISLSELIFMVPTIWALPSHLLIVAGIAADTSMFAVAIAVTLASMRMLPMVMALVPELRVPGTKRWHLLAVSNLTAITAWVHLLQRADTIPERGRLPYYAGFGLTMMVVCTIAAALVHTLAAGFPPLVMAALTFLTPLYFSTSIWLASRNAVEKAALVTGFVLTPFVAWFTPQFAVLIAGIGGGVGAYLVGRLVRSP